ncbi:MAG: hypothetical protein DSZ23_00630, partial [Thermodesulfatator sp.]
MDRESSGDFKVVFLTAAFFFLSMLLVLYHRQIYGFETRSALFVREMLEGGNLLVPQLYGRPYTDYPPLFFLMQYICSLPLGHVNALSISIPSAVSASLLIVLTFWFVRRHLDTTAALACALCLAGLPEFWLKAQKATLDMLLALECSAALICFFEANISRTNARHWKIAGYFFVIAALFTKGPVGLLLPLFCWFLYLLLQKKFPEIIKTVPEWIAVCTMGLCLEAFIFFVTGGPDLLKEAISDQFLSRLGGKANKPFYYYFAYLVLAFGPWLFWAAVESFLLKKKYQCLEISTKPFLALIREKKDLFLFIFSWATGMILPFMLSASRHGRYLLPSFVPMAILLGLIIYSLSSGIPKGISKRIYKIFFFGFLLIFASVLSVLVLDPVSSGRPYWTFLLLSVLAILVVFKGRKLNLRIKTIFIFSMMLIWATSSVCLITEPALSRKNNALEFVSCTEKDLAPQAKVVLFRIRPDKNGIKYALFSKAYPDRLIFISRPEELVDISPPFMLATFEKYMET